MAATRPAPPHAGAAWIVILAGVSAALHVGKLPPALPVLQGEKVALNVWVRDRPYRGST